MDYRDIEKKYARYEPSIYAPMTQSLLERLERTLEHQTVYPGRETVNDAIVYIRQHFYYGIY